MKSLIDMFKEGFLSKHVLAATLRAHQAAVDVFKSPQRRQPKKNLARIVDRISIDDATYGQEHDISVDAKTKVHDSVAPFISIFLMRQRVQHGSSRVCESL